MANVYSPTTRGRLLALELRRLRDTTGMDQTDAAKLLGWSKSKLSRIEGADTSVTDANLRALLQLYGAAAHAEHLERLRRDSWQRGWWTAYGNAFTGPFVALEDQATTIFAWETQVVPGLLQTEDYMQALIGRLRQYEGPARVHERVSARKARQAILTRPDAPEYRAVLDESLLRRTIGGADVMREQLRHLLRQAKRPNITIRVVPLDAGVHDGLDGAVTLFGFGDDQGLDVACTEGQSGAAYLESAEDLHRIRLTTESIGEVAWSPEKSAEFIAALAEE